MSPVGLPWASWQWNTSFGLFTCSSLWAADAVLVPFVLFVCWGLLTKEDADGVDWVAVADVVACGLDEEAIADSARAVFSSFAFFLEPNGILFVSARQVSYICMSSLVSDSVCELRRELLSFFILLFLVYFFLSLMFVYKYA